MSQPSWTGRTLKDRYEIEDLLGQGGMSAVYKANDPNLRRTVAVKLIHSHLSEDPQFVSRFEEEAAAVAQLKHPNIIQVFDFDHDDDTYYMVLEFLAGETLQERLTRLAGSDRSLPVDEAINIAAGTADALDYAHNRGMVHRDVKPANIMINMDGNAILMDFGVAKIIGGKEHTATGAVVGTAKYMSPEQIRGETPDKRVDIYALGVTLFEMLTGKPPYEAESAMSLMMMHVNDPVPDVHQLNPDVPSGLTAVIAKALAKDKNARYQTAAEFAAALRAVDSSAGAGAAAAAAGAAALGATTIEDEIEIPEGATTIEEPLDEAALSGSVATAAPPADAAPAPIPPAPAAPSQEGGRSNTLLIGGGIAAVILICAIIGGGYFAFSSLGGDGETTPAETQAPEEVLPTEAPVETAPPVEPTDEPAVTEEAIPTEEPTATEPTGPFVSVSDVSLNGSTYVVTYETFGYTEMLPGMHIHFFFDTVAPEQAGVPGSGPWFVYGGPRPFQGYTTGDKPPAATQMCALVANANHSVIQSSGNCVALPSS